MNFDYISIDEIALREMNISDKKKDVRTERKFSWS